MSAVGHPDWSTWAGRSVGGEQLATYSFSGSISSDSSAYFDVGPVDTGEQWVFQGITLSCDDDTAINNVTMQGLDAGFVFFEINFINGGIYDFPGYPIGAGNSVRITFTNNAATAQTFEGAVYYVKRAV